MLYHGLSIMLAPVLILQGLKVRRTTPRLAEPEGERVGQTGPNPTLKLLILGDSAAAGVGVTNQSEALLGQILEQLSPKVDVNYALFAKTGATTSSTLKAIQQIDTDHPVLGQGHYDVIVTSLGVNDITSSVSCEKWLLQQQALFTLLKKRYTPKQILVTALPPLGLFPVLPNPLRWSLGKRANQFNHRLQQLILKLNQQQGNQTSQFTMITLPLDNPQPEISMLDFMRQVMASDGFHPGAPIYNAWAGLVVEQIVDGIKSAAIE
ncbi:SGNH/GDSL hydrolase family protein [Shewanella basaltis]|uniref:SGNH/GDSL hydrolase family protein n=1 Tax=Shewanella basaltis TaxID=472183 RepID=UPI00200D9021|nr:SGNH/GDSL hydrolase family protein [Shewanella basaltis]MCL1114459.1 SGNH/GDSL hydrolase family protein [Shewanella basaltis]